MIEDGKCIFDIKKPKDIFLENDFLLQICFDFCDYEDILYLSLASKKFNKIAKNLDYKFEEAIDKSYFSDYNNYE